MKRKTKRTAGERRYRALKRRVDEAAMMLTWAQNNLTEMEAGGRTTKAVYIMQRITEAKERLRS